MEVAYFRDVDPNAEIVEAPLMMLVPTWVLVAANVYFGIAAGSTTNVARRAAELLLGVGS